MSDFSKLRAKLNRLKKYIDKDVPVIVGVEAVNHFKESFEKQGFEDEGIEKWEDVKRRDPSSGWYGFMWKGEKQVKGGRKANRSEAAKSRPILSGETQELRNSIDWIQLGKTIKIYSTKVYAQIQNEGGEIKVFGKHTANIPKRQFMGKSGALKKKLEIMISNDIKKIFK